MAIKVLECQSVVSDSSCTLILVGEVDEVEQAFADHAGRVHSDVQVSREAIEGGARNAVLYPAIGVTLATSTSKSTIGQSASQDPASSCVSSKRQVAQRCSAYVMVTLQARVRFRSMELVPTASRTPAQEGADGQLPFRL